MKKVLLIVSAALFLLASCSKNDDTTPCALNASSFAGTYKITAATYQANSTSPVEDDYATWDPCEKDNILTFNSNGAFSFSEGAIQCNPPQLAISGTWTLSGSIVTITVSINGQDIPSPVLIENFDCRSFKLRDVDSSTGEITVNTFTKQ
jgi:hypothetical protein